MKILYIASTKHPDYQSDMLFHGLRSLYGSAVVDANRLWYMYPVDFRREWDARICKVYGYDRPHFGRGFTTCGTVDDTVVDRASISQKISDRFFDLVIYGAFSRCKDYSEEVRRAYPSDRLIVIDGEDSPQIDLSQTQWSTVFKRELTTAPARNLQPINFCIPIDKIVPAVPPKMQEMGTVIPNKSETYIFNDEAAYYIDYQKSCFAVTHKKGNPAGPGGWDCLRHYEILMNGCVPHFADSTGRVDWRLENCPEYTMTAFPKELVRRATESHEKYGMPTQPEYMELANALLTHTRTHLTTTAVATKVLEHVIT